MGSGGSTSLGKSRICPAAGLGDGSRFWCTSRFVGSGLGLRYEAFGLGVGAFPYDMKALRLGALGIRALRLGLLESGLWVDRNAFCLALGFPCSAAFGLLGA